MFVQNLKHVQSNVPARYTRDINTAGFYVLLFVKREWPFTPETY